MNSDHSLQAKGLVTEHFSEELCGESDLDGWLKRKVSEETCGAGFKNIS